MEERRLNWYVVYTKPRNEKKVTERLVGRGYNLYCPLVKTKRQWSDRKKMVKLPMFTSYIFARLSEDQRHEILEDPGILNFVFWQGKPATLRDEEIEAVRHIENNGLDVEVKQERLRSGDRMVIEEGPFRGMAGVVDKANQSRITVYIPSIDCKIQFKYQSESSLHVDRNSVSEASKLMNI
jgi:transcription antitermination factor NusG